MPLCTRHHFALIIENSCLIWKFDDTCKLVFTLPDLSINCCILSQTTVAKTKEYTLYQISVHCIQVLSTVYRFYHYWVIYTRTIKDHFFFHDFINKWNMEFIPLFVKSLLTLPCSIFSCFCWNSNNLNLWKIFKFWYCYTILLYRK